MAESCENCRFWLALDEGDGLCRRYPEPTLREEMHWCGEWSPNDEWFSPKLQLTEPDDESPDEDIPS